VGFGEAFDLELIPRYHIATLVVVVVVVVILLLLLLLLFLLLVFLLLGATLQPTVLRRFKWDRDEICSSRK